MSDKETKTDPLLADENLPKAEAATAKPETTTPPADGAIKAPKPVVGKSPASAVNEDIISKTKRILYEKHPLTNFIIPLGESEKPGAVETVQINGYGLTIQKGVMVQIPLPVAKLLAEKYRIAMVAGQEKRLDQAKPDVQEALK